MYKDCAEALHKVRVECQNSENVERCAANLNVHARPGRVDPHLELTCTVAGYTDPVYVQARERGDAEPQVVFGMPLQGGPPSRVVP